jgi:hypothetical protein
MVLRMIMQKLDENERNQRNENNRGIGVIRDNNMQ